MPEGASLVVVGAVTNKPGTHRRIFTEDKANVVAADWGTEFIQVLAVLAVLDQDYKKKRMNCTTMI